MHKTVLVYGEGWRGTMPELLVRTLREKGYKATLFDYTTILPGIANRSIRERVARRIFGPLYVAALRREFVRIARNIQPACLIVSKGLHLDARSLADVKALGTFLVNWNPDDFFNLKTSNADVISCMRIYDLIGSSRPHLFTAYREGGVRSLVHLDWYYVPELHTPRAGAITIETSFVGSWSPHREEFLGKLRPGIEVWGGGWERSNRDFRKRHRVHDAVLSQEAMSDVFARSRTNLNILTPENRDYSNLRLFEVTASGGLLLTEHNESALAYLDEGKDALMYASVDQANEMLAAGCDRAAIARNGCARIRGGKNTFEDRLDTLLEAIGYG